MNALHGSPGRTRTFRRPILPLAMAALAVLPALACEDVDSADGSDVRDGSDTRMQDSADVLIVENPRPPDGSRLGWRVGPEMAVSIGEREGEDPYLLYGATDATRLSDGRIVVVNFNAFELRVFDDAGTHVDTWGGHGEGPNEFEGPIRNIARLPGDTVMVWDSRLPTVSVVDPTGEVARRFRVQKQTELRGDAMRPVAVLRDGSILTSPTPGFFATDTDVLVELRDAEGEPKSSLGTHAGMERHFDMESRTVYTVIFGRRLIREAWGELSVVTPNTRYQIRAFAQDGSLARIVRREHVMRTPTDAHVERYIEDMIPSMADPEAQASERERFERVPVNDHLPAFASMKADALDHLWVKEYEPPGEESPGVVWCVFDPEGRVLGFVETPEGLLIYDIGEDYILGRVTDEMDVEFIEVWPLERVAG